jgi:hypothetical protein
MKKFWLSWWYNEADGEFELHNPWWISGYRFLTNGKDKEWTESSVCAAVIAENKEDAGEQIYKCYDKRPANLEFRFIEARDDDWSPYGDRFQKAKWMNKYCSHWK